MSEVIIPPWIRPESPETIRIIDDATSAFPPAFGRGMTQRGIFADPRWGLRRRYRGLRSDEKAAILNALNESRGQLNAIRVTPHAPIRGSFATSELLTNNSFASGTTGWTAGTDYVLTSSDRLVRALRAGNSAGQVIAYPSSTVAVTQYVPYVSRFMVMSGRGSYPNGFRVDNGSSAGGAEYGTGAVQSGFGLLTQAVVPNSTTLAPRLVDREVTGGSIAGDYVSIAYASVARCALVDNAPNFLLQADELDTSWTATRSSVDDQAITAPDGSTGGDSIIEDGTASNSHFIRQDTAVSSVAADYSFTVALKAGARTWANVQMLELTGSTVAQAYINLSTGAVGTTSAGANWSNLRTFVTGAGSGWFIVTIVARKTNAATSVGALILLATADGTASYSGNGTSNIYAWGATLAQSSVPTRMSHTTSTALTSGIGQTGGTLYTKGWPASTNGLLLIGDWFEINCELKQLTAPVNSDAAGLAHMQFRPGLAGAPADNDPIIVFEPFGRFIYPGTREFENLFGIYGDCEMNLEEIYS